MCLPSQSLQQTLIFAIQCLRRKKIILNGLPDGTTSWSLCHTQTSSGLGKICIYSLNSTAGEHKRLLEIYNSCCSKTKSVSLQASKVSCFHMHSNLSVLHLLGPTIVLHFTKGMHH